MGTIDQLSPVFLFELVDELAGEVSFHNPFYGAAFVRADNTIMQVQGHCQLPGLFIPLLSHSSQPPAGVSQLQGIRLDSSSEFRVDGQHLPSEEMVPNRIV